MSIVNPLSALSGFQNQQLQRFTTPRPASASPTKVMRPGAGQEREEESSGVQSIRDSATRQHNLFLQALEAQQRRRSAASQGSPTGGGSSGGRGGGSGYLTGRHNLLPVADKALGGMNAAFRQQFGYDIPINEGGRTRARQQQLYDLYRAGKGNLAARPGTSLHESGRAVDLGGAFQNANSREHRWLQANAGRWGYKWTGKNFSQFEPWHWEWHG